MAALPFIFVTDDLHVISSATLQSAQNPPQIPVKIFYKPQVEDIKLEFFNVKLLGTGTAEEWLKGLDAKGKERRNDALRWERWELTGGVRRMRSGERAWIQDTVSHPTPAIANNSITSSDSIKSLALNLGSKNIGDRDGSIQFSGYPTQTEPISAPFCKILSCGTIVLRYH
jgi:hypothetical protein